jgi:hypothetical protein
MSSNREIDQAAQEEPAQFRLKEFELLRGEVEHRSQEQRAMERNVVILTAAIFTFLVSKDLDRKNEETMELLWVVWIIPPFVSFLALSRWLDSLKMIKQLAGYLSVLETKVVGAESGWENSLSEVRGTHGLKFCSLGSMLFWMLIVAAPTGIITYRLLLSLSSKAVPAFLTHFVRVALTWAGGDVKVIAIGGAVATVVVAAGAVWYVIHRTGLDVTPPQANDAKQNQDLPAGAVSMSASAGERQRVQN